MKVYFNTSEAGLRWRQTEIVNYLPYREMLKKQVLGSLGNSVVVPRLSQSFRKSQVLGFQKIVALGYNLPDGRIAQLIETLK